MQESLVCESLCIGEGEPFAGEDMRQRFGHPTNHFPFARKSPLISSGFRFSFMHTNHWEKEPIVLTEEWHDNKGPENIQTQISEKEKGPAIERGFWRIQVKSTLLPIRNHHSSISSINGFSNASTGLCIRDEEHRECPPLVDIV